MIKPFILFVLTIFLLCFHIQAQDILIKKSGEELKVKIKELTASDVLFQYADSSSGNIYMLSKADVFMIKYASGLKSVITVESPVPVITNLKSKTVKQMGSDFSQDGHPLRHKDFLSLIAEQKNQAALDAYYSYRKSKVTARIFLLTGIPVMAVSILVAFGDFVGSELTIYHLVFVSVGASFLVPGIILNRKSNHQKNEAINLYNLKLNRENTNGQ